jgi:hypothetical protein
MRDVSMCGLTLLVVTSRLLQCAPLSHRYQRRYHVKTIVCLCRKQLHGALTRVCCNKTGLHCYFMKLKCNETQSSIKTYLVAIAVGFSAYLQLQRDHVTGWLHKTRPDLNPSESRLRPFHNLRYPMKEPRNRLLPAAVKIFVPDVNHSVTEFPSFSI